MRCWILLTLALFSGADAAIPDGISGTLQQILSNNNDTKYRYPTDLTRGIIPKAIHSHNDYWRDIPFYSALSYGAVSIEADVFLVDGSLFVGHERSALTTTRTFQSLYVQPLLDLLTRNNPTTAFVNGSMTKNGVYDTDSGQTLYLFIDLKTPGDTTWPVVLKELDALRSGGWLTTTSGSTITPGAVTVVGTGNTPLSYFQPEPATPSNPRYTFYDAPLATLESTSITSLTSSIASTDFAAVVAGPIINQTLNSTQLSAIRRQIATAKSRGIKARYWDQPGWPIATRNTVWRTLLDEGVGLINVDDLAGAAGMF